MKVYSISKWAFFGICALILSLPLSRHWRLFSRGETATGTVKKYTMIVHENLAKEKEIWYVSEIRFQVKDSSYVAYGPKDLEYEVGREIKLVYKPDDPSENCLLTFSGLYFTNYFILPLVLITVWTAFYLSFNSYSKKKRRQHSTDLAFSPYKSREKSKKQSREAESGKIVKEIEKHFKQHT
jgi:hypothetical protein